MVIMSESNMRTSPCRLTSWRECSWTQQRRG